MSHFEEKKEKTQHLLRKANEKIEHKRVSHFASMPKNADPFLVPVQIENISPYLITIKRDQRHDAYVTRWRVPLAPHEYHLAPGKKVILPNEYVIYFSSDGPNTPVILRKHYGSAMRD